MITFDDFRKIDLRVAKVLKAEKVENTEKLLKLDLDLGSEARQVVAGIAKFYDPKDLIGRSVIIVFNLEPRTLLGIESQGMLLAANDQEKIAIIRPDKEISLGTRVS